MVCEIRINSEPAQGGLVNRGCAKSIHKCAGGKKGKMLLIDRNQTLAILRLWQFFFGHIDLQNAIVKLSSNVFFRNVIANIEATTTRTYETLLAQV